MTFRFEKIGPVDHADITLGDLTIIAGRNNTGKTYLVYALYGFLKQREAWSEEAFFARQRHFLKVLRLSQLARDLGRSDRAQVQATPDMLTGLRRRLVNQMAAEFSDGPLAGVFSSARDAFEGAHMSVDLRDDDPSSTYPSELKLQLRHIGQFQLQYDGRQIVISVAREPTASARAEHTARLSYVVHHLLFRFLCPEFPRPFILSAERFGISLFYKELDFTKSQIVDLLQKMGTDGDRDNHAPYLLIDKNTNRYAQPIKDNIDYTRNVYDIQKARSTLADDKLFDNIRNLMAGYYRASKDSISFRSTARKRKFDIPLHLASSSARGLADLYFYLRHTATKGHLLIIDEPESHLDTGNQVLLARILSRFVRAGLKVLITTHSDYVIKEINNLIMLSKLSDEGTIEALNYSESDRLDPSSVRAYVAEDHRLISADVDDFGIDMPVFDETIDNINRTSRRLAAELQRQREQE